MTRKPQLPKPKGVRLPRWATTVNPGLPSLDELRRLSNAAPDDVATIMGDDDDRHGLLPMLRGETPSELPSLPSARVRGDNPCF